MWSGEDGSASLDTRTADTVANPNGVASVDDGQELSSEDLIILAAAGDDKSSLNSLSSPNEIAARAQPSIRCNKIVRSAIDTCKKAVQHGIATCKTRIQKEIATCKDNAGRSIDRCKKRS